MHIDSHARVGINSNLGINMLVKAVVGFSAKAAHCFGHKHTNLVMVASIFQQN